MTKMIFSLCCAAVIAVNAYASPKLPKYGTLAWMKLPGVKEVIRAAETGDVYAKYFLAYAAEIDGDNSQMDALLQDSTVPNALMNEEKLSEALKKFSEAGFYLTQQLLAGVYFKMQLVDVSRELWRKAAAQGDPVSQYNLGLLLFNQNKSKKAPAETIRLWEASAAQNYIGALKDMGLLWLKGEVTGKPDVHKAIEYLEKAAQSGHIQAMCVLAEIYENGRTGKVDKDLAIKYYKAAALRHPMLTGLPAPKSESKK